MFLQSEFGTTDGAQQQPAPGTSLRVQEGGEEEEQRI